MTWIDFVTLIIAGYSIFKGYRDGLIMQVASLLGLVFGAIFAGSIAHILEPGLSFLFRSSPHIVGPISYLIAFILILVGFSFLGKMISGFLKTIHVGCLNSIGGAVFCTLKWLLLFSVFLNLVEAMDSREWIIKAETKQKSVTHNFVKALMPTVVPYLSSHDKEKGENQDAKSIKQSPKNQNTQHYRQTKRHAAI
ncbi:MAG: Colicin production protein [Bacteroidetes bacterium]|jgi:membrane protein required for colicin V production|nr:Colicin production protein [Bacteroidota bacterium]